MLKVVTCSFLLLSFFSLGNSQSCSFTPVGTDYLCELSGGSYLNHGDPFAIGGNHIGGYTDLSVTLLVTTEINRPNLRFIPDTIFTKFPNLRAIRLSGNNIESAGEISSCEHLEFIDLSYNNIGNIPYLGHCKNLQEISFESNGAVEIFSNSFEGLHQLQSIWLANNSFTNLALGTFDLLPELKNIDLQHNQIQQIPANLFNQLPQLESINLGYNAITTINNGSFTHLTSLMTLILNDNLIPGISRAFDSLPNVTRLYLQNNLITRLDSASFNAIQRLVLLRVDNNQLNAIERDFFTNLPHLQEFNAAGNQCIDRELSTENDLDFTVALEACFRNWAGSGASTLASKAYLTIALLSMLFWLTNV